MSESTGTTEWDVDVLPVEAPPSPRGARTAVPAPPAVDPTASHAPATHEQEHRPVTPVLAPEAPAAPSDVLVTRRDPRPVSVPSHRADTTDDVVPTDPTEPRPASVARHSVETSAITLPVFAPDVDPSLPQPPDRLTLDDDVLVRMVERRLDDTATVDLMAVVQAQLQARRVEAARFASWAREMDRVGTDEAADALERTRLRFTGVIDVGLPIDLDEVHGDDAVDEEPEETPHATTDVQSSGPAATPSEASGAPSGVSEPASESAPAPVATPAPAPTLPPAALAEPALQMDEAHVVERSAGQAPRLPIVAGLVVAGLVVLAAVVLALVVPELLASAVLATVAVPVAGGLGAAAALIAVVHGPADALRVAARGPVAVVAGIVVSAALGYGVLVTAPASLAWQGWLVRLVGFTGMTPGIAAAAALLVAAAAAFVVAVLATGLRSSSRR
ncbi:hypothetical protein IFT90_08270 [Frigoribacterium sp. CFBP 8766]|uniref:hypothetical protein n=1 Tax=Frigoribacterium sp. CFBP 8766 TaxID=2775273 RepID=UPI00177FDA92|nr:hypothetical protein [Frigoribacterium sp. CFBP 8766]MBD8584550.1 hypothetical protein [Frigoribacterium sp. CFBP 8766]